MPCTGYFPSSGCRRDKRFPTLWGLLEEHHCFIYYLRHWQVYWLNGWSILLLQNPNPHWSVNRSNSHLHSWSTWRLTLCCNFFVLLWMGDAPQLSAHHPRERWKDVNGGNFAAEALLVADESLTGEAPASVMASSTYDRGSPAARVMDITKNGCKHICKLLQAT